jgi:hypothetical protein
LGVRFISFSIISTGNFSLEYFFSVRSSAAIHSLAVDNLDRSAESAGTCDVGRMAQLRRSRAFDRQRCPSPLRDQPAFFLGQGRVKVQHERIGVPAKLRYDERHPLSHQAGHEGRVAGILTQSLRQ